MLIRKIFMIILFPLLAMPAESIDKKGEIRGRVLDALTKEPIIGANVLVEGKSTGAATDLTGEFKITNLDPGSYTLSASAVGYKKVFITDVEVTLSKIFRVDFELRQTAVEIGPVTVTNDYFSEDPTYVNSISNFNYEEIRRAPGGFEDVVRALSVLPGVAKADAGRNDLIVRGGAPSENLYILDGIEIPNINHFGNQGAAGGPLSFVNLDFVKQTSFSTGGFPSMYGDKISSVLKIDLRKGRSDRIGGKATVSATQFGLDIEGPAGKDNSFILSARRSYLDFIFKAAGFGFVPEYYDVLSKADFKINSSNSFSVLFIGAFDFVKYFNNTPDQRYNNSLVLGSDQNQYTAGITYTSLFKNGFARFILSRNYVKFNTSQKDSLLKPLFLNNSLEANTGIKGDVTYKISGSSETNFGAEIKQTQFSAAVFFPPYKTTFGNYLPLTSFNNEMKLNTKASAYINYNTGLYRKINLNGGIRLDYFDELSNKFYFSPRFSVSYKFSDLTGLNFSTGIYYQSPSDIWLAFKDNSSRLKAIRADQYILGLDHLLRKDIRVRAEAFIKKYSDYPASLLRPYLIMANTGAGFSGSENNFASFGLEPLASAGSGFTRGIELSLRKKLSDIPVYGIAAVTYSKADYKAVDGRQRPGSYDQRWIINLSGGYKFDDGWEASMKFRFSSGVPYTPFNISGSQNLMYYNMFNLPSSHSLDIRIDKRWSFNAWSLITYIDVQNIYNKKNISRLRWDSRNGTAEREASIGILPSIGISAEL